MEGWPAVTKGNKTFCSLTVLLSVPHFPIPHSPALTCFTYHEGWTVTWSTKEMFSFKCWNKYLVPKSQKNIYLHTQFIVLKVFGHIVDNKLGVCNGNKCRCFDDFSFAIFFCRQWLQFSRQHIMLLGHWEWMSWKHHTECSSFHWDCLIYVFRQKQDSLPAITLVTIEKHLVNNGDRGIL